MKKLLSLLAVTLITLVSNAQDQLRIDSLKANLKKHNDTKLELQIKSPLYDTTAAFILDQLSLAYWTSNPDTAMDYAQQSLALSVQISYKKGISNAYNSLGLIEWNKGDYLSGLDYFKKAIKIYEEIGNKSGLANCYNNSGLIYKDLGNYPEALKNYFTALKIREETGDKKSVAGSYGNIGAIYRNQGNYPEALKNLFAALKISEEIGDKQNISKTNNNIGNVYATQGNFPEALKNYLASLKIKEEIGDKYGIVNSLNNIALVYQQQGNYTEALKNAFAAQKMEEETKGKEGITTSYSIIGEVYTKQKKYSEAAEYLNKALSLSKEIGHLDLVKTSYADLSTLDSAQGNFSKALEHYKLFIIFRDSVTNNENTRKTMQMQMQYDFDKKEAVSQAENEKELQKQKLVRDGFMGGFAVVLLFAGIFFSQRNRIKKGKKRSDELLLNILPEEVAEELKAKGSADAKQFDDVTVMFTDFKDFTQISEKLSPEELVAEIDTCFKAFDHIIGKHNIEKIKTIGDSYMCAGGLPVANTTNATDVVKAAMEIQSFMKEFAVGKLQLAKNKNDNILQTANWELRIGIHTGPVVAGIVGVKKFAYDIWGDTVNIASRMESSGEAGKVNISGSTYELVKTQFSCTHRGKIQAKNKGEIDMYFVET